MCCKKGTNARQPFNLNRRDHSIVTLTVAERVERQETIQAAHNALADYAFAVDHKDRALLSALFAPDAVLHTSSQDYAGLEAILGFYETRSMDPSGPGIRHFVTNAH